jgi:hypothetical protein
VISIGDEFCNEMGANEARSTGDEDVHFKTFM